MDCALKEGQTNFPYAAQFIKVLRSRTNLKGELLRKEVAYFVTSISQEKTNARQFAESIRGHWTIENSLHWVRDVTFDEDRSQIRTGSAPRVFCNDAQSCYQLTSFGWREKYCFRSTQN